MPSSDHIVSFLFSTLLHALGLLLLGSQAVRLVKTDATAPELKVSSVELALATIEPAIPSDAASDGITGQQQEEPMQPLDMPQATEQPPAPVLPDKPAFTDALTPPPEPVPAPQPSEPAPVPAPVPQAALTPPPPAAPQPSASAAPPRPVGTKSAAASSGSSDSALIFPANGGGGANGRIDAHPALNRPIKPNYPIGARRRGEEGTVILDVVVAEDGMAQTVTRVTSSGFPELDAAAERAAAKARFKPGTRDGKPVLSSARITIIFRLRDS